MEEQVKTILFDPLVGKIVTALLLLVLLKVIISFSQRLLANRIQNKEARYSLRKFVGFFGYILAILLLTAIFSDQMRGMTVALGVTGAGIAFALQEVIASIAGWIAVSFGQFYRIGDRVQLGGIKGDVMDIGMLRTTIMEVGDWVRGDAYNGRIVRVANSFVFKEPVFNYSADFPFVWDEISVPVKYGSDYRQARKILEEVALEAVGSYIPFARDTWREMVKKYMIEEISVEPGVFLQANDNWAEFTLRYVVDLKKRRAVKDRLFTRILEEFDGTAGKVSLASATFHLVETPVIDVRLRPAP